MMDDDFLYQFQKQPRPEFAGTLFAAIMSSQNKGAKKRFIFPQPILKPLALGLGMVCLSFAVLFSFSGDARAALMEIIADLGGIAFVVTDENPHIGDDVTVLTEQWMSLSEAHTALPFDLKMPTWMPEGFELQDQVRVIEPQGYSPYYWITLEWKRADPPGRIELYIEFRSDGNGEMRGEIVGPENLEEVQVNGQPAALVHGAWNHNSGEYDLVPFMDRLIWYQDGIKYTLFGAETVDDMIRIAKSLP